jgi:hypothetical protein
MKFAVKTHLTKSINARILHALRCARKVGKVMNFCAILTVSHLSAKCIITKIVKSV